MEEYTELTFYEEQLESHKQLLEDSQCEYNRKAILELISEIELKIYFIINK